MALICARKFLDFSILILIMFVMTVRSIGNVQPIPSRESERWKGSDLQKTGSSSLLPEYYDPPYGHRKDFITSSYEDKYSSNNPVFPSKTRQGFSPFSSGNFYAPVGSYDRRPFMGVTRPIEYGVPDFENHYDNSLQGQGYGLNHLYGAKDFSRSLWIPLAGAALLGIAAALVANPVLLHFGVTAGKRKRREITEKNAHDLAYRAYIRRTRLVQ
ncbi:uncharacterized protein LOC128724331 [Anopheles nili]|uniref:uncharacterized protein LOC128724331 n=1 Tax=Anopheles nili TaxID=185578 RepID=UPI00237AB4A7|nr:uncharacterized protein LOC128724331 [Anopheles nili]